MRGRTVRAAVWIAACMAAWCAGADEWTFPSAESLPVLEGFADPFMGPDGKRIVDRSEWPAHQRYLKAMLAHYQYGAMPPKPDAIEVADRVSEPMLDGAAVRETFRIVLSRSGRTASIRVGIVRPNREGRSPLVIKNDPWIFDLADIADADTAALYINGKRDEVDQAVYREAVARGYAICKFNREDVAKDRPDNRSAGVYPLYPEYDWGLIAVWAWAYQPVIDAVYDEPWLDREKIVSTGHSRGGKTALCAAIYDERIAVAAPSASGSGGTGSWRYFDPAGRQQDVTHMREVRPYWFGPNLYAFAGKEDRLPVDGHTAKAVIAPRAVFNTHGRDDVVANPLGTQATFEAAQVVFEWLGVPENQGLHWRPGGHGQMEEDWLALFDFCDRHFFGEPVDRVLQQMPYPEKAAAFPWSAP